MFNQEKMLAKIQKALGRLPADSPPDPSVPSPLSEPILPITPASELLPRFEAEFEAVGGKCYRARSREDLDGVLRSILAACRASRLVLSSNPILAETNLRAKCLDWGKTVDVWSAGSEESFPKACFAADIGVTGVSFALAESGTLVLTSQTEGAQLASLAPPVHIAFYRQGQLRSNLEEVLAGLAPCMASDPSSHGRSVVLVTGTSRTADIEQILIRGVHGPREEHAIWVEDTCFSASSDG